MPPSSSPSPQNVLPDRNIALTTHLVAEYTWEYVALVFTLEYVFDLEATMQTEYVRVRRLLTRKARISVCHLGFERGHMLIRERVQTCPEDVVERRLEHHHPTAQSEFSPVHPARPLRLHCPHRRQDLRCFVHTKRFATPRRLDDTTTC